MPKRKKETKVKFYRIAGHVQAGWSYAHACELLQRRLLDGKVTLLASPPIRK